MIARSATEWIVKGEDKGIARWVGFDADKEKAVQQLDDFVFEELCKPLISDLLLRLHPAPCGNQIVYRC